MFPFIFIGVTMKWWSRRCSQHLHIVSWYHGNVVIVVATVIVYQCLWLPTMLMYSFFWFLSYIRANWTQEAGPIWCFPPPSRSHSFHRSCTSTGHTNYVLRHNYIKPVTINIFIKVITLLISNSLLFFYNWLNLTTLRQSLLNFILQHFAQCKNNLLISLCSQLFNTIRYFQRVRYRFSSKQYICFSIYDFFISQFHFLWQKLIKLMVIIKLYQYQEIKRTLRR